MRKRKLFPTGAVVVGLVFSAQAAVWQRPETGTDLWYSGFLHGEASYTDVTGSAYEFEEGYYHGEKDGSFDAKGSLHLNGFLRENLEVHSTLLFDTRYQRYPQRYWDRRFWDTFRLSAVVETPRAMKGRWDFHARASYDREDRWRTEYPDARLLMEPIDDGRLELLARLESPNYVFEGGDLKPDFGGRGFILYQHDILGLQAGAHNELIDVAAIGGRVKGTTYLQTPDDSLGIRADGTAGPYRLGHAPIVRGSEVVAVEVRDRFDRTVRIRRTLQRRNVDYTIDYLEGVVTFMEPVLSETFEGHPVYISVQYAFDERDTGYRRYLTAARADLKIASGATFGVRYAGVADDADSWRGSSSLQAPDERRSSYGAVLEADVLDRTRIEATMAFADSGGLGRESDNRAMGLHLESRSLRALTLEADYQRIEPEYESLDNRTLVGQRNREEAQIKGIFRASAAVDVEGGGRERRHVDLDFEADPYTDRTTFAGLRVRPRTGTELAYRHEWRLVKDEKAVHERDETRETSLLEASQALGSSLLRLAAEREHLTNHAQSDRDATWRLRGAFETRPWQQARARAVMKTELVKDRDLDRSQRRRDAADFQADVQMGTHLGLKGAAELRDDYVLDDPGWTWRGGTLSTRQRAYSLGADVRPANPVQLIFAYDRERTRDEIADAIERESETTRAEGYWFATADLELHTAAVGEDLRDARKIGVAQGMLRRFERRFEVDATYNLHTRISFFAGYQFKRRRIFDPGRSDTDVQRVRLGANLHLHPRWELTGRVRYTHLEGEPVAGPETIDNRRWIATGELAWDASSMWRFAIGYESLEYEVDAQPADDYAADRFFAKLIQKF